MSSFDTNLSLVCFFYLSGGVAFHSLEDFFPQILQIIYDK